MNNNFGDNSLSASVKNLQGSSSKIPSLTDYSRNYSHHTTRSPALGESSSVTYLPDISDMNDGRSVWDYVKIFLIVLVVLLFLGVNVLKYIGSSGEGIMDVLRPWVQSVTSIFGYTIGETTKKTVKTAAEGTKRAADITSDSVSSIMDLGEKLSGVKTSNERKLDNKLNEPKRREDKVDIPPPVKPIDHPQTQGLQWCSVNSSCTLLDAGQECDGNKFSTEADCRRDLNKIK